MTLLETLSTLSNDIKRLFVKCLAGATSDVDDLHSIMHRLAMLNLTGLNNVPSGDARRLIADSTVDVCVYKNHFAIVPLVINNKWVWLKKVLIVYKYRIYKDGESYGLGGLVDRPFFLGIEFVDSEKELVFYQLRQGFRTVSWKKYSIFSKR